MVFVKSELDHKCTDGCKITGLVTIRDTGKYVPLILLESVFGALVALSNLTVIIILIIGGKRLMKNHFYVVLSNLIVCTSLKAFVELAFIVPYYIVQSDALSRANGVFSKEYEFIFFNISVFADYGVLFFSVLIAVNRFIIVARPTDDSRSPPQNQGLKTVLSCLVVWIFSAIIPVLFTIFQCQNAYDDKKKIYRNQCGKIDDDWLMILFNCLVYLSYACAVLVLILYLAMLHLLWKQHVYTKTSCTKSRTNHAQILLLKQSILVFVLYTASILCIFAMSFVSSNDYFGAFEIAYIENLLNLSIAAVYPICFLTISGELRSILLKKLTKNSSLVSSVRLSGVKNRIDRKESTQ